MPDQISEIETPEAATFTCPKCGVIPQDDVVFLCNSCQREDLVVKNGIYMCPSCLVPGENFECMVCNSKDVKMELKDDFDNGS